MRKIELVFYLRAVLLLLTILPVACSNERNPAEKETRELQFQESMSGVVLEGYFSTDSSGSSLSEERYHITKVSKLASDIWVFQARIQYGSHDVTVPVPVRMEWAGDTPILSLTDVAIPGLGTFTARVLFYDGHYVGVWQHGEVTGQHFGRIVPQ